MAIKNLNFVVCFLIFYIDLRSYTVGNILFSNTTMRGLEHFETLISEFELLFFISSLVEPLSVTGVLPSSLETLLMLLLVLIKVCETAF